ncbi:GNAT family N-acetyltransferase [Actinoplanes regularis]|uniref:GNAT family N-acetyltransferase n=1 Tax=Actinoplanes regularis TaxID=52697 RepID=UPI0024A1F684|nr:GNAT family N-acetyltransferase [Actinoplanes regularis]GLW34528.1 GCN5 family N-acetyltransferase [Actinoplanes regularis]
MYVRSARLDDLPALRDIERAAGQPFREIGMPEIAEDEPPSLEVLAGYQRVGRAWVALDPSGGLVGYLIAEPVDGNLHIEQVSVDPRWARRRIGRRLIEHLAEHARAAGVPALTLTTFADVPWNAPYYRRCGFAVLDDEALTPGLRSICEEEAVRGLTRWPRVCMRRGL